MPSQRRMKGALPLVVLVAAACGPQVPAEQRLAGAAASTTAQDTARFSVEARTEVDGAGMDFTVSGEGEADFTRERWRLEMQMPGMPGMDHGMELIGDGDVLYVRMRMPDLDDDRWMRPDPEDAGAAAGGAGPLGAGPGTDPSQVLEVLAAAAGEVEQLERTEIDGVEVEGYAFTVAAHELVGIDADAPEAQYLDETVADVEAWLDRDDRVRRIRTTMDMGQTTVSMGAEADVQGEAVDSLDSWEEGSGGEMPRSPDEPHDVPAPSQPSFESTQTVTIDWFDFGEPVDVELPDEAQVVDEATYLEGLEGALEGLEGSMSDSASAEGEFVEDDIVEFHEEEFHIEADSVEGEAVEPERDDADSGGHEESGAREPEAEATP